MKKITGWKYLCLALCALAGIGTEVILALLIEPLLYGVQMRDWSTTQNIIHWIITCIVWGVIAYVLIAIAKKKFAFDIFAKAKNMTQFQWIASIVLVALALVISIIDWNGFKVIKEFVANGWLKFIFQYIYYIFETALIILIVVFGQKAFEQWFKKEIIPYGGIVAGLTWGLTHIFTQGSLSVGLVCMVSALLYGIAYLLVNKDIKKAYIIIFLMFVL